ENTLHVGERISNQLTITQVKSNEELLKYVDVFISLFEGLTEQDELDNYFNKFSQIQLGPNVQMFVGCIDDMAVTTVLLIERKDSYGIYDVMTNETERGKGDGSEKWQLILSQAEDTQ